MKVLITGHKGYIGTLLAPMLRADGYQVVGLDSDIYRSCDFGSSPEQFAEIKKDIRDVESTDLEGFDAVLHLAGFLP